MRETKEVVLPSGIKATLKTYLTAGEYDDIQDVFLGSVNMDVNPENKSGGTIGKFTGSIITKAKYKTLESIVTKVGTKENPKEADFREMRITDVEFLALECDKLTPKKK